MLAPAGEGAFQVAHPDRERELTLRSLSGPSSAARLAASRRALLRLDHPGLVRVRDTGVADGVPFVVTDRVGGPSVGDVVAAAGPLALDEVVRLGLETAGALGALHDRRFVHGRLGPESVVRRPDGTFVLVDIDAALDADATPQADQEGLGALLFFALTGSSETDASGRASGLRPDVPAWLDVLVARCLTGQPRGYFRDLEDLERALRYAPPLPGDEETGFSGLPDDPPPVLAPVAGGVDREPAPPLPTDPPRATASPSPSDDPPPVTTPVPSLSADPPRVAVDAPRVAPASAPPLSDDPPPVGGADTPPEVGGPEAPDVVPIAPVPADLEPVTAAAPPRPSPEPAPDRRPLPPAVAALQDPPAPAGDVGGRAGRGGLGVSPRALWPLLLAAVVLGVLALVFLRDGEGPVAAVPTEEAQEAPDRDDLAERAPPPDAAAPPPVAETTADLETGAFTAERAQAVADAYLRTGNAGDRAAIRDLYADRVQYYDRGSVARDDVLRDKDAYLRRWPERAYRRVSDVDVEPGPGASSRLRFDYTYRVAAPGRDAEGAGWAELTVRPDGDAFQIIGEDGGVGAQGGAAPEAPTPEASPSES